MKQEELLERVLKSKEERSEYQKKLINRYKLPIISLTLNLVGGYFRYDNHNLVWNEAVKSVNKEFLQNTIFKDIRLGRWGFEGFWVLDLDIDNVKKKTIEIEKTHKLGRLFDIDVIDLDGTSKSRGDYNIEPRKCILCDEYALECYIKKNHSVDELKLKVEEIIEKGLS